MNTKNKFQVSYTGSNGVHRIFLVRMQGSPRELYIHIHKDRSYSLSEPFSARPLWLSSREIEALVKVARSGAWETSVEV